MEDILASIRRIIADDQDGVKTAAPGAPKPLDPAPADGADPAPSDEEILDLAEIAEPSPAFTRPHEDFSAYAPLDSGGGSDPEEDSVREPAAGGGLAHGLLHAMPPRAVETAPVQAPPGAAPEAGAMDERLLSHVSDAAVSHAFNMLAHTVFSQNAMTLEDVVKDMLRPLLKDWLDDNLPPLVERLVRAEIERVARSSRR